MTVLAGDIGGTNARLAIYEVGHRAERRRRADLRAAPIRRPAYPSLDVIVEEFLATARPPSSAPAPRSTHACFGIAGPIENNICRATNLPWVVDGRALSPRLGIERVTLVNDFYAAALGVTAVGADRAGRARRRAARRRTGRSRCSAPAPGSARRSSSGRRPTTATRSSRPRAGTSTSRRARRSSSGWFSS